MDPLAVVPVQMGCKIFVKLCQIISERIKLVVGGNLGDGLSFFECFENDLGLEGGTILFSHGRVVSTLF